MDDILPKRIKQIFQRRISIIIGLATIQVIAAFFFLISINFDHLVDAIKIPGLENSMDFFQGKNQSVQFNHSLEHLLSEYNEYQYAKRVWIFGISWMFVLGAAFIVGSQFLALRVWNYNFHVLIRLLPGALQIPTFINIVILALCFNAEAEKHWRQLIACYHLRIECDNEISMFINAVFLTTFQGIFHGIGFYIVMSVYFDVEFAVKTAKTEAAPLIMYNNHEMVSISWSRHTRQAGRGPLVLRTPLDYRLYRNSTFMENGRVVRYASVQDHLSIIDISELNTNVVAFNNPTDENQIEGNQQENEVECPCPLFTSNGVHDNHDGRLALYKESALI